MPLILEGSNLMQTYLGDGFKLPYLGKCSNLTSIFSDGLVQPPTRYGKVGVFAIQHALFMMIPIDLPPWSSMVKTKNNWSWLPSWEPKVPPQCYPPPQEIRP